MLPDQGVHNGIEGQCHPFILKGRAFDMLHQMKLWSGFNLQDVHQELCTSTRIQSDSGLTRKSASAKHISPWWPSASDEASLLSQVD